MKHSPSPKRMSIGTCFICGEPCERYCHLKCAIAFDSEKQRLLDEAKINSLKELIEEKDKLIVMKGGIRQDDRNNKSYNRGNKSITF
jgi:hypothetical protein